MDQFEFFLGWVPTNVCHYQEQFENIRYCHRESCLKKSPCVFRSKNRVIYAKNGSAGGSAFECLKKSR